MMTGGEEGEKGGGGGGWTTKTILVVVSVILGLHLACIGVSVVQYHHHEHHNNNPATGTGSTTIATSPSNKDNHDDNVSSLLLRRKLQKKNKQDSTKILLEEFKAALPSYTLTALLDATSPQSLALDWLAEHPHLESLEEWRMQQLFALATIYYSMDGPNWIRPQVWGLGNTEQWLNYTHSECQWYSVWEESSVCNSDGQLMTLDLDYLQTSSTDITMPPEVGLLSNLVRVSYHVDMKMTIEDLLPPPTFDLPHLERISLLSWGSGGLPTQIGKLAENLKSLAIYHNYIIDESDSSFSYSGSLVPTELGLCTNLMDLTFHNIGLGGSVPTQLGGLTKLNRFALRGTNIVGSLPSELGRLTGLIDLSLMDNPTLGGSLPVTLGALSRLSQVSITNNANLGGKIPSQLFVAMSSKVQLLDLSNNRFENVIPTQIGLATKLRTIDLQGNQLRGQLPSQLGLLTKLYEVQVQSNMLEQTMPSEIGGLAKTLRHFNASYNGMTDVLPTQLGLLDNIETFDMSHNQLEGELPPEVLSMGPNNGRKGWEIDLSYNNLSGELFSGNIIREGNLDRLLTLRLHHNKLRGEIPTQFGLLSRMNVLDLSSNEFESIIPSELGMMKELTYLNISNLGGPISGPIPSQMAMMTNLIDLDLSKNPGLVGEIPTQLGDLVLKGDLHYMDVTGNIGLMGTIPHGLCQLNTGNKTFCYYRESCTFQYGTCGSTPLCGCDDDGCFCSNVNIERNGGPFN